MDTKKWIKEYNKTWYWWIAFKKSPKGFISMTPVRLFGKTLFWKCKIAKSNYQWNKLTN
jgi:hypothetical protein